MSSLERGLKAPTLNKIEELAEVMDFHPLTLLTLSYMMNSKDGSAEALFRKVANEIQEIYQNDV